DDADPALAPEVRQLLAEGHRMAGNPAAALRELELAADGFAAARLPARVLEVAALAAQIAWEGRGFEDARRWVQRGLQAAPDDTGNAALDLLGLGATLANLRADYEVAKEYLARAEQIRAARA